MNKLTQTGQSLMELVVGVGFIAAIITALAITTTYSSRNTQFSKNQALATKFAQENMEKVRTIKSANYGVCVEGQSTCYTWEEILDLNFGAGENCPYGCTYVPTTIPCTVTGNIIKPFCLTYSAAPADLGNGFTGQIIMEDETGDPDTQQRVISRVFWTDSTGQHSSELVTVFSRI